MLAAGLAELTPPAVLLVPVVLSDAAGLAELVPLTPVVPLVPVVLLTPVVVPVPETPAHGATVGELVLPLVEVMVTPATLQFGGTCCSSSST